MRSTTHMYPISTLSYSVNNVCSVCIKGLYFIALVHFMQCLFTQCFGGGCGGWRFRSVRCQVPMTGEVRPDYACRGYPKPQDYDFEGCRRECKYSSTPWATYCTVVYLHWVGPSYKDKSTATLSVYSHELMLTMQNTYI